MKLPAESAIKGFTLIEIAMAMAILVLIFALSAPVVFNFYLDYQLSSEEKILTALLAYTRNLAMSNINQSDHGLYLDVADFIVFQGSSYTLRDSSQDKKFPRSDGVNISGLTELTFGALSGRVASSTFVLDDSRKTKYIYLNEEGRIQY